MEPWRAKDAHYGGVEAQWGREGSTHQWSQIITVFIWWGTWSGSGSGSNSKSDPDLHQSEMRDPDPKNWFVGLKTVPGRFRKSNPDCVRMVHLLLMRYSICFLCSLNRCRSWSAGPRKCGRRDGISLPRTPCPRRSYSPPKKQERGWKICIAWNIGLFKMKIR